MIRIKYFILIGIILSFLVSCNVIEIEKYNEEFTGDWYSATYYSSSVSDSIKNYITIAGKKSSFGVACHKTKPFVKCLTLQQGRAKYNKANHGLQVGNSIQMIHFVDQEPFVNESGEWEMVINQVSYYKY